MKNPVNRFMRLKFKKIRDKTNLLEYKTPIKLGILRRIPSAEIIVEKDYFIIITDEEISSVEIRRVGRSIARYLAVTDLANSKVVKDYATKCAYYFVSVPEEDIEKRKKVK